MKGGRAVTGIRLTGRHLVPTAALIAAFPAAPGAGLQSPADSIHAGNPTQYVHQSWTTEDGLPVNSIRAVLQDGHGYVWLATFDGLVRFDGQAFTVFDVGNSPDLPSNRIIHLAETEDGALWLVTEAGHLVRRFDGAFTQFGPEHGLSDVVRSIAVDGQGALWLGTPNGVHRVDDDRVVPVAPDLVRGPVTHLTGASDGAVWIGTPLTVFRYRDGVAEPVLRRSDAIPGPLGPVCEGRAGTIWMLHRRGIVAFDGGRLTPFDADFDLQIGLDAECLHSRLGGDVWIHAAGLHRFDGTRFIEIARPAMRVGTERRLASGKDGAVWAALGSTVYREGVPVLDLRARPTAEAAAAEVLSLLLDREEGVWMGTASAGLHRVRPSLFTVFGNEEGLARENVYAVLEDAAGAMWFAIFGAGLSRLRDGEITNFGSDRGYHTLPISLLQDRKGRLWQGFYSGPDGVDMCTTPDLECHRAAQAFGEVRAMHEDRDGHIWLGTAKGLFRSSAVLPDPWPPPGLPAPYPTVDGHDGWVQPGWWIPVTDAPSSPVRVFLETTDGALWMGTGGGGLSRFMDGEFTHVTTEDGLPIGIIRSLYQDEDGWLWVGTEGRGLARLDPSQSEGSQRLAIVRAANGLFDETIHAILEDDAGRLWMSTNRGIFWVRRDELNAFADGSIPSIRSTWYDERDGLRNREANGGSQPAALRAGDGRLWFATQAGAVVVDPRAVGSSDPPRVTIERLDAGGESRPASMPAELAADHRDIEITYSAPEFSGPNRLLFRYRLDGYDDDWVDAGNRRTAFYTGVPPGHYTFEVVATNHEGVISREAATLAVAIAPFFYETALFRTTAAMTLILVVLGGFRLRVHRLQRRERELEGLVAARTAEIRSHELRLEEQNAQLEAQAEQMRELDRAKSRLFANISHEFRTPLTLTVGPLEDLHSGLKGPLEAAASEDVEMALRNARRLLRLVNQILDVSKLEAGRMVPRISRHDVTGLVRAIAHAFAPLAERKRIDFSQHLPADPVSLWIDPDLLEKALTNLVSNAFKFSGERGAILIDLTAEPEEDVVRIRVRDQGSGIAPEDIPRVFERFYQAEHSDTVVEPGTGIGLSLARELVELHGGRIEVESEVGFGSTFTVVLRQGREHLPADWVTGDGGDARATQVDARPPANIDAGSAVAIVTAGSTSGADAEDAGEDDDRATILIVDDNPDVRAYVRAHLSGKYRLLEAEDGRAALTTARTQIPDLVISDVMMPHMNGMDLVRGMRSDATLDFVPIILLTAKADVEDKLEGLERGADDYLTKPFDFDELEARIQNLIRSRERLKERVRRSARILTNIDEPASADERLLDRIREVLDERIADEEFDVERLALDLGYSRATLYRRLQGVIDHSPAEMIFRARLERAARLLAARAGTVAEVAYGVGFKSVSHFSRRFREWFGVPPSEYSPPGTRPD